MSALPPAAARAHAARVLAEHGFREVARNTSGDSLYLQPEGYAFALRLSNHSRTPKQRQRRTDVLASLVIREPRSPEQVAALVAGAVRDFMLARARREAQTSGAASRK
ncbi:hypothetical protein [uncultured Methylobacterium sp.]|uniref:hypothetical protein n=1 Tax=uncultured Methylobacterium sp. TaxID=157278 RepID=UPI0035C9AF85